jgi:hypothetical protein
MSAVDKAVNAIIKDLGESGIAKDRSASTGQGSYRYRGIDDVMQAVSVLLPKHGLCIYQSAISHDVTQRTNSKGTVIFRVREEFEFELVAVEDGSSRKMRWISEADDSSDKATNKAGSVAYREFCLKTFCIPVNGADADTETEHNEYGLENKLRKSVEVNWEKKREEVGRMFLGAKDRDALNLASAEVRKCMAIGAPSDIVEEWRHMRDRAVEGLEGKAA